MPNKSKSSSKLSSAEAVEGCEDAEFTSVSVIRELLQSQECIFQNFVESIAANVTKRVDDLVTKIAKVLNLARMILKNIKRRLLCLI